jgi:hypothetical protein
MAGLHAEGQRFSPQAGPAPRTLPPNWCDTSQLCLQMPAPATRTTPTRRQVQPMVRRHARWTIPNTIASSCTTTPPSLSLEKESQEFKTDNVARSTRSKPQHRMLPWINRKTEFVQIHGQNGQSEFGFL